MSPELSINEKKLKQLREARPCLPKKDNGRIGGSKWDLLSMR
jgi:hypothetical protein